MPIPPLEFGKSYLIYERTTGLPQYTVDFPVADEMIDLLIEKDYPVTVVDADADLGKIFVLNGTPANRPTFNVSWRDGKHAILADMVDSCWLDGIPAGATVIVDKQPVPVTNGSVQLGADTPGTYTVSITAWPYLDWHGAFTAT